MNLFSEPKVFTFAMNWNNPDNVSRESLTKILKIITPLIDAKMFMKIESPVEKKSIFVFRGFITYYGKHYMAYFYSEKKDTWIHFNDSRMTEIGNFEAVINK